MIACLAVMICSTKACVMANSFMLSALTWLY